MTTRRRRRFTAEFKKRVALEALRGDRTVQEIAARHEVHPNQVSTWKRQAIDGLDEVFGGGRASRQSEHEVTVRDLHAKIGERLAWRLSNTMDTGFCVEALEAALRTGTPGIVNTDQGSQFRRWAILATVAWVALWMSNVVEQLWILIVGGVGTLLILQVMARLRARTVTKLDEWVRVKGGWRWRGKPE